jgi:hypothetical protein
MRYRFDRSFPVVVIDDSFVRHCRVARRLLLLIDRVSHNRAEEGSNTGADERSARVPSDRLTGKGAHPRPDGCAGLRVIPFLGARAGENERKSKSTARSLIFLSIRSPFIVLEPLSFHGGISQQQDTFFRSRSSAACTSGMIGVFPPRPLPPEASKKPE